MAVIFDEVTADVQPAAGDRKAAIPAKGGGSGAIDPHRLRRELERLAARQARLKAD